MQQKAFIAPSVRCALFFLTTALLPVTGKTDETAVMPEKRAVSVVSEGRASYYADRFHGRRTASGERFSIQDFTAAHRTLPFGTAVRVTNLDNGREVTVRINDCGPHRKSRIIDVSPAAARELGLIGRGTASVRIVAVN